MEAFIKETGRAVVIPNDSINTKAVFEKYIENGVWATFIL